MTLKKEPISTLNNLVNKLIPDNELNPKSIEDVIKLPSFLSKIEECEKECKLKYAEVSHEIQDALVLRRLQQITNIIKLNPIWAEQIEEAGLKGIPENIEDWQKIPLTNKETQKKYFMGDRPGLVVPLTHGGFEIVASGGTSSGTPVESVYSLRELNDTYKIAGEFIGNHMLKKYLVGDEPKWVATTLADYQMWSSGTMVGGVLQKIPDINYIGAGPLSTDVYQHMMSYKGPKAIMAISQGIAMLTKLGEGMNKEARESFKVAMYGSGVLTHLQQKELKELYPNVSILSYFAATQAETIGLQLEAESQILASVPGLHLIEIVDENGKWVSEGEEGELVITRLHANEAPILRFKLGDRMIRRPNLDTPALKTTQFEFAGRSGDVIHLRDTQYSVALTYENIALRIKQEYEMDLTQIASEIQFVNERKNSVLTLLVTTAEFEKHNEELKKEVDDEKLRDIFIKSLINSLPLFNKSEANPNAITKTDYKFAIDFVPKDSEKIFTTTVGKVPLIRDIF
jgi:phenylacetate-CoA ligase